MVLTVLFLVPRTKQKLYVHLPAGSWLSGFCLWAFPCGRQTESGPAAEQRELSTADTRGHAARAMFQGVEECNRQLHRNVLSGRASQRIIVYFYLR
jgi:hypothetical protein